MEIITLDAETTGPNPLTDKLVTLFIGKMDANGIFLEKQDLLFNPGIDIPVEASNVHGITTEKAAKDGIHPDDHAATLLAIRNYLVQNKALPLVVYNAPFDLTLLNLAFAAHNIPVINFDEFFVFDPFVVDKAHDKYRKGSRQLADVAVVYNVKVDPTKTHTADYDCYLTGSIALKLLSYSQYAARTPEIWMSVQKAEKKEQANSLETYLRKIKNDDSIVISGEWPERKSGAES